MMKALSIALILGLMSPAFADEESEEVIEISPFSVTTDYDSGYTSGSLGRTRVHNSENSQSPSVPVTIVKRADSVAVQIVIRNDSDKPETRNRELFETVNALEKAAKAASFVIEQREVRFSGGERKILSFSRGGGTSFVNLVIFAPLKESLRVADVVKSIRDVITPDRIIGKSRVADGTVGLVLKDPDQYRREILNKIFEDLDFVRKGIGSDFELQPSGLNKAVLMRPSGEGELELWIDYSFSISSIKVITSK